jgi:hypothetical protein
MTPYEAWTGNKPSLAGLRVFGCLAWVHIPKANRRKLDNKARVCVFVGYSMQSKAYLCYDRARNTVITSRDVEFAEHVSGATHGPHMPLPPSVPKASVLDEGGQDFDISTVVHPTQPPPPTALSQPNENGEQKDEDYDYGSDVSIEDTIPLSQLELNIGIPPPSQPPTGYRRSGRHHASSRAWDTQAAAVAQHDQAHLALPAFAAFVRDSTSADNAAVYTTVAHAGPDDEPTSFSEAMSSAECSEWQRAAKDEMNSIQQAGTWTLTPLPADRQAIGCSGCSRSSARQTALWTGTRCG